MDSRIQNFIEHAAGLPITEFPDKGVCVRVSKARTDEPKNRLLVLRVGEKNGALITVIPRLAESIKHSIRNLSVEELFSPYGLVQIKKTLPSDDAGHIDDHYGMNYFIMDLKKFRPIKPLHKVIVLKKKDIPVGDEKLRIGERCSTETDDFTWAFACYHDNPDLPVKVLSEYGPCCASVAVIFWKNDDIAGFGVATEEGLRGQGYATDVVSVGTQFILDQGGVAWYGAYANNTPSLHIPRRLGYTLVYSSFSA